MKKLYLILTALTALTIAGCGNATEEATKTPDSSVVASPATKDETEPEAKEATEEPVVNKEEDQATEVQEVAKAEVKEFGIDEKATFGDWELTIKSFKFQDKISANSFSSSPDAGTKFAVVTMAVTNNGTSSNRLTGLGGGATATLFYNSKYEYNQTGTMIDGDLDLTFVDPLQDVQGFVVFQVPEKVSSDKEGTFDFRLLQDDGEEIEFKLK